MTNGKTFTSNSATLTLQSDKYSYDKNYYTFSENTVIINKSGNYVVCGGTSTGYANIMRELKLVKVRPDKLPIRLFVILIQSYLYLKEMFVKLLLQGLHGMVELLDFLLSHILV